MEDDKVGYWGLLISQSTIYTHSKQPYTYFNIPSTQFYDIHVFPFSAYMHLWTRISKHECNYFQKCALYVQIPHLNHGTIYVTCTTNNQGYANAIQ